MLTLMLAAAAQLAQPACPIDRQLYRLQPDARFTAGFARLDPRLPGPTDLAFWLKTPKRTYWFGFASPNGYGGTYLMPGPDPEAAARTLEEDVPVLVAPIGGPEQQLLIEFDAFHADLSTYQAPPQVEDAAPARLFARGLGPALWYNAVGLSGGDARAETESMPIGMFEPADCAPARR